MAALPKGKTYADKYFPGFYRDGALKAILDLAANYPCAGTAFIGWFPLHGVFQRAGEGTKCMTQLWAYLKQSGFLRDRFFGA